MTAACVDCGRPVGTQWQFFSRTSGPLHLVCFHRTHPGQWPRTAPITPEDLMTTNVVHLHGFREPWDINGVSGTFLRNLDERFRPVVVQAAIDFGQPVPFTESAEFARARALEQIRMAPGAVVLSGYSAGAMVMGSLARDIAEGRVDGVMASDIAAVALLADPLRPEGEGAPGIPTPGGYGIAGQRYIPDIPTFWGTASRDPISSLAGDNPLRSAADLSKAFTVNPLGWDRWARDMFNTLTTWQMQPWWKFWHRPGRWGDAILALNGYLTVEHTGRYIEEGVCVKLAAAVNEAVGNG